MSKKTTAIAALRIAAAVTALPEDDLDEILADTASNGPHPNIPTNMICGALKSLKGVIRQANVEKDLTKS